MTDRSFYEQSGKRVFVAPQDDIIPPTESEVPQPQFRYPDLLKDFIGSQQQQQQQQQTALSPLPPLTLDPPGTKRKVPDSYETLGPQAPPPPQPGQQQQQQQQQQQPQPKLSMVNAYLRDKEVSSVLTQNLSDLRSHLEASQSQLPVVRAVLSGILDDSAPSQLQVAAAAAAAAVAPPAEQQQQQQQQLVDPRQQQQQPMAMMYSPALQGHVAVQPLPIAQITLSTQKIFKFRTFTLFLELSSAYVRKHKLTEDDILKAGLNAKCFKENAPDQELVSCQICSAKKKIIELGISNKQAFGPKKTTYGTETYTFDTCKTNCSSSRDHHKSHLLIVIDSLPGAGAISSMPFMVQAREKQQGIRKSKSGGGSLGGPATLQSISGLSVGYGSPPVLADPAAASVLGIPQSPMPGIPGSTQPRPILVPVSAPAAPPPGGPSFLSPVALSSSASSASSTTMLQGPLIPVMPVSSTSSFGPVLSAAPDKAAALDVKVKVTLMSTTLNTVDADKLIQNFKGLLSQMPGYIQFKYSLLPGLIVGFSFFDTEDHHKETLVLLRNFIHNAGGITNPYDRNLMEGGVLVLLAVCCSW